MPEVRYGDGPSGPVLENEHVRLTVNAEGGTISLAAGDVEIVASSGVRFADGGALSTLGAGLEVRGAEVVDDAQGRGRALILALRAAADEPELAFTATLYENQPFVAVRSTLTNTTDAPLRVHAFDVLRTGPLFAPAERDGWRFYRHGWQSWSPTLTLSAADRDLRPLSPIVDPATRPEGDGTLVSELVTSLAGPDGRAITTGFISTADQLSQVWLDGDGALTATSYADGVEIAPGETLSSERAVVDITSDALSALPRYGEALGREMGAVSWPHVPSGWCSWYQYFGAVTEDDIVANLERLAALREDLPLEYVQVDDGYQSGIGDWLTVNEKFPHGMAWLAERIHERGFKAGLWLAPFLAGAQSRLFAEHPDWMLRSPSGEPAVAIQNWGQLCYALDCTRPEVIQWLDEVFRTVTEEWGYDYVKIDFVYAAAIEGVRFDPNATRAQAYRRGLEAIRRAVGDRFVLGCGAPIGPSVGLVNGMRIGPDVAPAWYPDLHRGDRQSRSTMSFPAAVNALRNTITRYWTHGSLWQNDPDCLLLRDRETSLTDAEVRTLATVIGMSGGMPLDSDDLSLVSPERREMLARLLPLRGPAAVPLDLFERDPPRVLWRADAGLLAVVNWEDMPRDVTVEMPVAAERLRDFWSGEEIASDGSTVALRLPAHGSRLLALARSR
ncbi:MAG: glycoside hydrolase family 36 protein [Dehalococcoidia bacterium]